MEAAEKVSLDKELQDSIDPKEYEIYTRRFSDQENQSREYVWSILCKDFFQKYISPTASVLDIGAGDGYFIKQISAAQKYALDLSPHARELEKHGVKVFIQPATNFRNTLPGKVDVVFMSNFLEHLRSKDQLMQVLDEVRAVLKPTGKVIILQPNIRYVGPSYWDYIDHHIALTEHSLAEALEVCGFSVEELIPRFFPYTVKSKLGHFSGLIRWYLKMPFLWKFFGAQTFVVGRPA